MADKTLLNLRSDIDAIDTQIVELLNKRAAAAQKLGGFKRAVGKEVYDPTRENEVLNKINSINAGPLPKGSMEDVYAAIITACREIQNH